MRKIALIFGSINGAIVIAMVCITMPLYQSGVLNHDKGEIIGYTTMLIASSLIFFGVKTYRDNQLHGAIKFGRAVGVGLLIGLVAALTYAIVWEFYYNIFAPNFMEEYANMCMTQAQRGGAAEVQKVAGQIAFMREIYKNPFLRFGITMSEILPVEILISLVSAAILRKKGILPAQ